MKKSSMTTAEFILIFLCYFFGAVFLAYTVYSVYLWYSDVGVFFEMNQITGNSPFIIIPFIQTCGAPIFYTLALLAAGYLIQSLSPLRAPRASDEDEEAGLPADTAGEEGYLKHDIAKTGEEGAPENEGGDKKNSTDSGSASE